MERYAKLLGGEMSVLQDVVDRLLGRGQAAVTVPPLDGALKPNNRLEDATVALAASAPDNLVSWQGRLVFSSGSRILGVGQPAGDAAAPTIKLPSAITAMASSPDGLLAVATLADGLCVLDRDGQMRRVTTADHAVFGATAALAFAGEHTLLACIGSTQHAIAQWSHDLLSGGRSGSLWKIDLRSGAASAIATGLAFPNGLAMTADGDCIVSESWQHRLLRIAPSGTVRGQVLDDLPGYPGRLVRAGEGYWLSIFAPRSQLIEFVLREPAYRRAMMKEVPPELWIAPTLASGNSVLEPMQGGALKQMGILKPWAPSRSYGLVVELNDAFVPVRSLHSRAGGRRHGITSAQPHGGALWVTSKGGGEVVALDLAEHVA